MRHLRINHITLLLPSAWDELSRRQLYIIIGEYSDGISLAKYKLNILLKLLQLKIMQRRPMLKNQEILYPVRSIHGRVALLTAEQLTDLSNQVDFLFVKNTQNNGQEQYILNSNLTKNLLPRIKYRGTTYYGPADRLYNLTFEEWLEADNHYMEFTRTGDPQELARLVATLYRPKASDPHPEDPREAFNTWSINTRGKKMRSMSMIRQHAVRLYYQGCRNFLSVNFPHVFTGGGGKNKKEKYGPLALIDALTGDDITKNEAVRQSKLYNVMVRLEMAAIDAEEIKERLKKKR